MNVDSILQEIGAMKTKMNKKEKIVKTPEEAIETIKSNMPHKWISDVTGVFNYGNRSAGEADT